jgi:anti-sigma regulatory factor (Ser/Thr protein kinase)
LEVSDRGGGDPEELRAFLDPDGLPDLEDERGRGFFLLASSVDSLTVEANPEGDGLTFKAERRYEASKES